MNDVRENLDDLRIDRDARQIQPGWWFWASLVVIAISMAGAGLWWWSGRVQAAEVRVMTVQAAGGSGEDGAVLNASGYVTARRRATVSSKITGKVTEVLVDEGMHVRQGQVLARLDDSIARAMLRLAEAQLAAAAGALRESEVRLAEARLTLGRRQQLFDEGVIGRAEVDAAQAEVDSLRARIEAAGEQAAVAARQVELRRAELDDTVIRAPFSGVAISKDAQPGEMVSPVSAGGGFTRTGICTIVDMTSLEIEVDVSESYINRVRSGQPVTAILDAYPDWRIPAHVITTVPAADRQRATVLVRIALDALDERILPDMGVKVTFHREEAAGEEAGGRLRLLVPGGAVRSVDGVDIVFVVRENRVERRAVRLGAASGDRVEIVSGLNPGDRIVVDGPAAMADGDTVVIRTN
jgi:RND family efflux transporter MFP subunit